jgi:AhpD family alkylhydroperoxidase
MLAENHVGIPRPCVETKQSIRESQAFANHFTNFGNKGIEQEPAFAHPTIQPCSPQQFAYLYPSKAKESQMLERVNLGKAVPELYQAVGSLDKLASQAAKSAGLADGFCHVLRLRASQINQCAFCVRLHTQDALKSGETTDRISVLPAWRETEYFSEKERAALELVEAITLISDGQVPDSVYAQASKSLSSEEIAAIEWVAVVINAWNRIAISSRYPVKP